MGDAREALHDICTVDSRVSRRCWIDFSWIREMSSTDIKRRSDAADAALPLSLCRKLAELYRARGSFRSFPAMITSKPEGILRTKRFFVIGAVARHFYGISHPPPPFEDPRDPRIFATPSLVRRSSDFCCTPVLLQLPPSFFPEMSPSQSYYFLPFIPKFRTNEDHIYIYIRIGIFIEYRQRSVVFSADASGTACK